MLTYMLPDSGKGCYALFYELTPEPVCWPCPPHIPVFRLRAIQES